MNRALAFFRSWPGLILLVAIGFALSIWLGRIGGSFEDRSPDAALAEILNDRLVPMRPGAKGDVTLVVYTDYACPICRSDERALVRLADTDRRITILYKDWPILGYDSIAAARAALAAGYQDKYEPMHRALMTADALDEPGLERAASKAGVDWERLKADRTAHAAEIDARLARTQDEARELSLQGTPAYLADRYLAKGGLGDAGFARLVSEARAAK